MDTIINQTIAHLINVGEPKRVLHIGGFTGEEADLYEFNNISFLYCEPNPTYYEMLTDLGFDVLPYAVTSQKEAKLYITTNEASSSINQPLQHSISETIEVPVIKLGHIQEGYDTLVVDTGSSIDVLQSGDVAKFAYVICEISANERYKGEGNLIDLCHYMFGKGFVITYISRHGNEDIYDILFERI